MARTDDRVTHLAWAKERALEYVDAGDLTQAFTSFVSDLSKNPMTQNALAVATQLGMPLLMSGHLSTPEEMRKWIEGFN